MKNKTNNKLNEEKTALTLNYIGKDSWCRPVYQDQFEHLWKDIDLGDSSQPNLCSSSNNEFEGEPDMPINQDFIIV